MLRVNDTLLFFIKIQERINRGLANQQRAAPPKNIPNIPTKKAAIESPHELVVQ